MQNSGVDESKNDVVEPLRSPLLSGGDVENDSSLKLPTGTLEQTKSETDDENQVKHDNKWENWHKWVAENKTRFPGRYKLVTDEDSRKYSLWALRYAILSSAINTKLLNPNYPIMCSPGIHDEAFPNTDPFEFNSATYFIPMCSLLGVAISSIFVGKISDRTGRKPVLLFLAVVSGFGSIVKYFTRHTFWGFCISNFVFGFFLGNLPVGMAYISSVFTSKKEKEDELGVLVGYFVLGNSGGGMIAILMEDSGLFAPLWVGAGIIFLAAILIYFYLIEPGDVRMLPIGKDLLVDAESEEVLPRPLEINQCGMWNVVGGALADNIGSTALFPLCLSPLALEHYYADFAVVGEDPIMSLNAYKWLSVCVALMVVPSTIMTPHIFARIGAAGTCVLGNILTAIVTILLLVIGNLPPTTAAFAGFVIVLYGGFPFTVFSQLTTGPMLDVLAPEDKVGYVQGLNNSAMNFGMAFAPWLLGLLADAASTNVAIWTGIGISFLAAAINFPLVFRKEMGPPEKQEPPYKRPLLGEDEEFVNLVLQGEFVAPDRLFEVNRARALKKKPLLIPRVKPYEEEKDKLIELGSHAEESFKFRMDLHDRVLEEIANPKRHMEISELLELLNSTRTCGTDVVKEKTDELGQWIGDYLLDNGYNPHIHNVLIKQMVISSFPTIVRDGEYTEENMEQYLLRFRQVINEHMSVIDEREKKYSLPKILGTGSSSYITYS